MSRLARSIALQYAPSVRKPRFVLFVRFTIVHKLVEHDEITGLQTLALADTPVLVPAFKQVTLVKLDRLLQSLCLRRAQILSGYLACHRERVFKIGNVQPN